MAKPIIVIELPNIMLSKDTTYSIKDSIKAATNDEYHVLVICNLPKEDDFKFNVYNDCKGLKDVDIESLTKEAMK